jgi:hypothetical protein
MKRHPMDSVALVFALLFSAALTWWGIAELSDSTPRVPAAWIGAGTLLVIGLVGLISALRPQPKPVVEAPLTVAPEPQPALAEPLDPYAELYADPYFHASGLKVGNDVLDAEAVAAAYREAGFEDAARLPAAPGPSALAPAAEVPSDPTPTLQATEDEVPTTQTPRPTREIPRSEALTTEVPRLEDAPTAEVSREEAMADAGREADTVEVPRRVHQDGPTLADAEPEADEPPTGKRGPA